MLDKIKHITIGDKEYPMAYTLNVMEDIQEKFGTIGRWGNALQPEPYEEEGKVIKPEPRIKDIKWTFAQFINEGIDIENEEKGEKRPFVTEKQVGRLISMAGMDRVNLHLMSVTAESTKTSDNEGDNEIKNETTTQKVTD